MNISLRLRKVSIPLRRKSARGLPSWREIIYGILLGLIYPWQGAIGSLKLFL